MTNPTPNDDEEISNFIGSFHKSLPHNQFGEVDVAAYREFRDTCLKIDAGQPLDFEEIAPKKDDIPGRDDVAKFTSPMAGASTESLGPDPRELEMPPAPGVLSESTAAEMVELYWMAALRDVPLHELDDPTNTAAAVTGISHAYQQAINQDTGAGAVKAGLDLPQAMDGRLDISHQTLFGCGLKNESMGPRVSQFFLQDIPYGVQTISPMQYPYVAGRDFLTDYNDWLDAQNRGTDRFGRDYGACNNYQDQLDGHVIYYGDEKRYISTMRDLARFVNRDALHQAYFNAALFLDAIGTPLDEGNPYHRYKREGGFATLGGPDLLTLVSEVASRALKVVWRQKWMVHRRCRPEVYGGLLHVQNKGVGGQTKPYELGPIAGNASVVADHLGGNYLLPMAFSAGSPNHPAYGAGHATVAGACVTVLKAWFYEDACLEDEIKGAKKKDKHEFRRVESRDDGEKSFCLLKPGSRRQGGGVEDYEPPQAYEGGDLTVVGELNKLASNVAMGRSMGGVHWRSDNTRSLRLGEQIAIEILRKRTHEYAEAGTSFTFTSFDGDKVTI